MASLISTAFSPLPRANSPDPRKVRQLNKTKPFGITANSIVITSQSSHWCDVPKGDQDLVVSPSSPPSLTVPAVHQFQVECGLNMQENVRQLLRDIIEQVPTLQGLEMVDAIKRLGLDCHFEEEIKALLSKHYIKLAGDQQNDHLHLDLYAAALRFRLLRQEGYCVPAVDVFDKFTDEEGKFEQKLTCETTGLMELYEASQLVVLGETILDEARDFSRRILEAQMPQLDQLQARAVANTLAHPQHMVLPRFSSKRSLAANNSTADWMGPLRELAKLDSGAVQSMHQNEMLQLSRWEFSQELPKYMKTCLDALDAITNEIGYKVYVKYGWNPIGSLRKTWADLCKAFMVESKWFVSKKSPNAEEYLRNAVVSSGAHVVLIHIFFLLGQGLTEENVHLIDKGSLPFISSTATILRLWDDLGSAEDEHQEGNDGSYVEYYTKEHPGCTMESAREHVMQIIENSWKQLNQECISPTNPFPAPLLGASLNLAKMVPLMYTYDDNQSLPLLKQHMNSLLINAIETSL